MGAEEVARQAEGARSSLGRWKRALGATVQAVTAVRPSPDLVEVPAPVRHGAVAEVMTNGGAVRLFAAAAKVREQELFEQIGRLKLELEWLEKSWRVRALRSVAA